MSILTLYKHCNNDSSNNYEIILCDTGVYDILKFLRLRWDWAVELSRPRRHLHLSKVWDGDRRSETISLV